MPVTGILQGLNVLAERLLPLLPGYVKAKQEHRERLASYCEQVADCLSRAFRTLEEGRIPHGCCVEMDQYMKDLRDVLKDVLPEHELDQLRDALAVSYEVEYIDRELGAAPRGSKYAEIDKAAGRFRAIAQRVRATRSTLTSR